MAQQVEEITNSSLLPESSDLYKEEFSYGARFVFLFFGVLALAINIPAIIVLRKTKKVPFSGKFLSSGLLIFDATFIFFSTVRKFIPNPIINVTLTLLGTSTYGLSVISLAMMAFERYALFFYPMKYLKHVTNRLTRVLACSLWAGYLLGHWFLRYGACYIKLKTNLVFMQAGVCNDFVMQYLLLVVATTTCVCIFCYASIISFVRKKSRTVSPLLHNAPTKKKLMLEYKSTMFVFMCTSVMCVSFIAYGVIIALNITKRITIEQNRVAFESVSLLNCLLDPLWYVLWFRECRLEGLKILSLCNHKLLPKAEEMRMEIFNIVTSAQIMRKVGQTPRKSTNKHQIFTRKDDTIPDCSPMKGRISSTDLQTTSVIIPYIQSKADALRLESLEGE